MVEPFIMALHGAECGVLVNLLRAAFFVPFNEDQFEIHGTQYLLRPCQSHTVSIEYKLDSTLTQRKHISSCEKNIIYCSNTDRNDQQCLRRVDSIFRTE